MLHRLASSDPRFRTVTFRPGLNLLIADRTPGSRDTDSRNGTGKSSFVELVHFLLGASVSGKTGQLFTQSTFGDSVFTLHMDWSEVPGGVTVRRSCARPAAIDVDPDLYAARAGRLVVGPGRLSVPEWNQLIETDLFGLRGEHPNVSGRVLLSFLARRQSAHAFNEASKTVTRGRDAEGSTNLAYLLGLDWRLAGRYHDIAERKRRSAELRKAAKDPATLGQVVGRASELRSKIIIAQADVDRLQRDIDQFRVVPQYEQLKARADELNFEIYELGNADAIDQANLDQLERATADSVMPEVDYLDRVYRELGVNLGDQVRRRYDEVSSFHESVVRNRQAHLAAELSATRDHLAARKEQRERLGAELERVLSTLASGGALDSLTMLQRQLGQSEAELAQLRARFQAAQDVESSARTIRAQEAELAQEVTADLNEREQQVTEAVVLFRDFVSELYSGEREGRLEIAPGTNSLRITPTIAGGESGGIGHMAIFCFDLAVWVTAHRAGRAPDFLIHDSHLFDGVDARQIARALNLGSRIADEERLQYIVTLNSDDLNKAREHGKDPAPFVIDPVLSDDAPEGRLFGFEF